MTLHIAVCAKQVPDPEAPPSSFQVDEGAMRVVPTAAAPPVINGFDMQAAEAALRIRDSAAAGEVEITVLSVGTGFSMDAMRQALAVGADRLALVDDAGAAELDGMATARVLAAALKKMGPYRLVLCGRQASDWDQGYVPLALAELLRVPCVSFARKVEWTQGQDGGRLRVERALPGGYQVVETPLPAVVSVSNELGEPRFPTLRGIMEASKKAPVALTLADLDVNAADLAPGLLLRRLYVPESERRCELIEGVDERDAGRKLASKLREAELI
ncbi:MAG: electron transfer flavoprotein subunit beta/FixA family protein [Gemmatimonadetes bacterium]|nr:electron transfer flavoprotein subunit beta/FixA family protein [Gemmatimonadota bacterium]